MQRTKNKQLTITAIDTRTARGIIEVVYHHGVDRRLIFQSCHTTFQIRRCTGGIARRDREWPTMIVLGEAHLTQLAVCTENFILAEGIASRHRTMVAMLCFVLGVLTAPFKSKSRLEAENATLRRQLVVLRRKVQAGALVSFARIWREKLKLIWLSFPFF